MTCITLPSRQRRINPWLSNLLICLESLPEFGLAEVKQETFPLITNIPRPETYTLIKVDNKTILLGVWDYSHGLVRFLNEKRHEELDLSLIIYCQKNRDPFWDSHSVPITNWTMWHCDSMNWIKNQPEYLDKSQNTTKEYSISFSGRLWKSRRIWVNTMEQINGSYASTWPGRRRTGTVDDYIDMLTKSKSTFVIRGQHDRYSQGLNRREVECASVKVPMILNYQPYYLNELVPGKHYLRVSKPAELQKVLTSLTDELAAELAHNAYEWWEANASVEGVCRTFMQALSKIN